MCHKRRIPLKKTIAQPIFILLTSTSSSLSSTNGIAHVQMTIIVISPAQFLMISCLEVNGCTAIKKINTLNARMIMLVN